MRLFLATVLAAVIPASGAMALTTSTVSFQKGDANGYAGPTELLISDNGAPNDGRDGSTVASWGVDGYAPDDPSTTTTNEFSPDQPSLTKFDNIFGNGANLIPAGATILSAQLTLSTTNGSAANTNGPWSVASLNSPFTLATRYADFPSGSPLGFRGPWWQDGSPTPYTARPLAGFARMTQNDVKSANIGPMVQQWATDPTKNNGFVVQSGFTGTSDGWNYYTSGYAVQANRPKLTVTYTTSPIQVTTFQHGVNGYTSDTSAWVKSGTIAAASATNPDPSVDDITYDGATGAVTVSPTSTITPAPTPLVNGQAFLDGPAFNTDPTILTSTDDSGLFKFGNVFGNAAGQSPADKPVAKAWLVLTTGDASDTGGPSVNARSPDTWVAYTMKRDWNSTSLYSTGFGATPGLQAADGDFDATALDTQQGMTTGAQVYFDVTNYMEAIRNGATDYGLAIVHGTNTTDGWQVELAQASDIAARPQLIVYSDMSTVVAGVPGDYNNDGVVNAADYVVWRSSVGSATLTNRSGSISGVVGQADYDFWRAHFGATSGSGSSVGNSAAVPEPTTLLFALIASLGMCLTSSRNR